MNGAKLTSRVIHYLQEVDAVAINLIAASKAGYADVIACYNGRFLALEIKGKGDTEKPAQAQKLNEVIEAGGYGKFIHSMQDLYDLLNLIDKGIECPKVETKVKSITL